MSDDEASKQAAARTRERLAAVLRESTSDGDEPSVCRLPGVVALATGLRVTVGERNGCRQERPHLPTGAREQSRFRRF